MSDGPRIDFDISGSPDCVCSSVYFTEFDGSKERKSRTFDLINSTFEEPRLIVCRTRQAFKSNKEHEKVKQ
jgi:hypothetical protein